MKAIGSYLYVCLFPLCALAQSVAGSGAVGGAVLDNYGEGLPDAEVIVENRAMGVRHVVRTSLDGVFLAAGLPPAAGYRLQVTRKKFRDWKSDEFEVPAGRKLSFEVSLQAEEAGGASGAGGGAAALTRPLVDPSPYASDVVTGRQIETLPAPGRLWESLALLAPTVSASRPLGAAAILGDAPSNAYYIDGLLANNGYPGGRSAPAGRLAQDAVQGFEVLAGGAPVEFGHAKGGMLNAVTRSGGSGLHGDLYEYLGGRGLNATGRHALGHDLSGRLHQFGFNLGGAIPRSKLFFFSNLEVLDSQGQGMNRITNPLIADAAGTSVAASNCKATEAQCAAAARFIGNQMNVLVPGSEHWVTGLAKLDYRRSDRHTLSLSAYATRSRSPRGPAKQAVAPDGGLLGNGLSRQDTRQGRLAWVSTPGRTSSNELRLGLFDDRISNSASASGLSTGTVSISLAGTALGETHPDAGVLRERRSQIVDNFRVSFNTHSILLGVEGSKTRDRIDSLANASGTYFYSSLTAFAQDLSGAGRKNYTRFTQTFGKPFRDLKISEFAFYLQDAWRISPRLHAIGGVRWSKPYLPQPTERNSTYYDTARVNSPNINADPRIGISYLADQRTVVRAGFGMFHAPHPGEMLDALFLGNGVYQTSIEVVPSQTGAPLFPSVLSASSIPGGTTNLMYAASKLRSPYTKQTTAAVERHLRGGFTASATYTGTRGTKLWTAEDMNLSATTKSVIYTIAGAGGGTAGGFSTPVWTARSTSYYAHVYRVVNGGSSWYRALTLQLRTPTRYGFSARASYTWSHGIDDVGGPLIGGAVPLSSYNADHRADRGSSATDQRHRAVVDWLWQPRVTKSDSAAARYLLNGWEASSVVTLASSQPATALVVVNGQQFTGVTMAFPGSMNGSGGWPRVPFLPVNHLYAEPEYTVNARLVRPVPISERITGRLVFEAFNLFNTQFDTGVKTIAYTATGGVLAPVPGVGTGNAAMGYPSGSNARSCRLAFRLTF